MTQVMHPEMEQSKGQLATSRGVRLGINPEVHIAIDCRVIVSDVESSSRWKEMGEVRRRGRNRARRQDLQ